MASAATASKKKQCSWYGQRVLLLLCQVASDPPFTKPLRENITAWDAVATVVCETGMFVDCDGVDGLGK